MPRGPQTLSHLSCILNCPHLPVLRQHACCLAKPTCGNCSPNMHQRHRGAPDKQRDEYSGLGRLSAGGTRAVQVLRAHTTAATPSSEATNQPHTVVSFTVVASNAQPRNPFARRAMQHASHIGDRRVLPSHSASPSPPSPPAVSPCPWLSHLANTS